MTVEERLGKGGINSVIPEERTGKVRDFGEMKFYLPEDLPESTMNLLRGYFDATLFVARKKPKKARRVFESMKKIRLGVDSQGKERTFRDFEDENTHLISIVQVAVLGESRQNRRPKRSRKIKYV